MSASLTPLSVRSTNTSRFCPSKRERAPSWFSHWSSSSGASVESAGRSVTACDVGSAAGPLDAFPPSPPDGRGRCPQPTSRTSTRTVARRGMFRIIGIRFLSRKSKMTVAERSPRRCRRRNQSRRLNASLPTTQKKTLPNSAENTAGAKKASGHRVSRACSEPAAKSNVPGPFPLRMRPPPERHALRRETGRRRPERSPRLRGKVLRNQNLDFLGQRRDAGLAKQFQVAFFQLPQLFLDSAVRLHGTITAEC